MARQSKLDKAVKEATRGITLTKAQQASVRKQIKAKKTPKLTLQGITLTLPQLKRAQRLLEAAPINYFGQQKETPSFLTAAEVKKYKMAARKFNNAIRAQQARETAISISGRTRKAQKKGADENAVYAPVQAHGQMYRLRYENAGTVSSREQYESDMRFFTTFTSSKSLQDRRNLIQQQNWLSAFRQRTGSLGGPIADELEKMPASRFHTLITETNLPNVGDVYIYSASDITDLIVNLASKYFND